jgi:hypothetical protein
MTKKYRVRVSGRNKILEEFLPIRPKTKAEVKRNSIRGVTAPKTKGKWALDGYHRHWIDIVIEVIDREIIPIGDDLRTQLESLPQAIEAAAQKVMEELELPEDIS